MSYTNKTVFEPYVDGHNKASDFHPLMTCAEISSRGISEVTWLLNQSVLSITELLCLFKKEMSLLWPPSRAIETLFVQQWKQMVQLSEHL